MKKKVGILWECLHVNECRGILFKDFMYVKSMFISVSMLREVQAVSIEPFIYLRSVFLRFTSDLPKFLSFSHCQVHLAVPILKQTR